MSAAEIADRFWLWWNAAWLLAACIGLLLTGRRDDPA